MLKKGIIFTLFIFVLLLSGCETVKETTTGFGTGAAKDTTSLWQAVLSVDRWIKDNLW